MVLRKSDWNAIQSQHI